MSNAQSILRHYGNEVPSLIGEMAGRNLHEYQTDCIQCVAVTDTQILTDEIVLYVVEHGDERVVLALLFEDDEDRQYYAFPEDCLQAVITRLVRDTNYVVEVGDDEYLPDGSDSADEDCDGSVKQNRRYRSRASRGCDCGSMLCGGETQTVSAASDYEITD